MISNRLYRAMSLLTPFGYHLGLVNFTWNSEQRNFKVPSKPKMLFKINMLLCLVWVIFVAIQMFRSWQIKDYTSVNLIFPFMIGGIIATFTIATLADPNTIFVLGTNTFLFYLQRINRK